MFSIKSIIGFFTLEHILEIFLVFCALMIVRWVVLFNEIFVKPTKMIYLTCRGEGSHCEVKEGCIRFWTEYEGRTFIGKNMIDYRKVLSGEKTLIDYANVAYDEMHQAIDRYNETKH